MIRTALFAVLLAVGGHALAQQREYRLDAGTPGFRPTREPEPGTDEAFIENCRRLVAEGQPGRAIDALDTWIELNQRSESPWLPDAYLIRGDAKLADNDEYDALYDYEMVIKEFPATQAFADAVAAEYEIAREYLRGKKKKFLGLRIENAEHIGEELMLRVAERLPKSRLAERAVLEMGDYYARERELRAAVETYDVFTELFDRSERLPLAYERRMFASIARFKGPSYDGGALLDALAHARAFEARLPIEARAAGVDALKARIDESAAAQMLDSAKWYLRKKDDVSARLVLRRLVDRHPGTVAADRAAEIVGQRGWFKPEPAPQPAPEPTPKKPAEEPKP